MAKDKSKKPGTVKQIMKNGLPMVFSEIVKINNPETLEKAITQYLDDLAERGETLSKEIHDFAIYAMEKARDNSNGYALMTALQKSVTRMLGVRHARLAQWFAENSPASWNKKEEKFVTGEGKDNSAWRIEYAKEHPFYEKPEVVHEPFSLAQLERTIKTAIARAESDKANPLQQQKLKELAKVLKTVALAPVSEAAKQAESEQIAANLDTTEVIESDIEEVTESEGESLEELVGVAHSQAA